MSSVVISGNTSGTVTLFAPDVSGNTTLTLPTSNGTVLTQNSSAPANSLVVDASGNVGIGTSSPSSRLNVTGTSVVANIESTNNNNVMALLFNGTVGGYLGANGTNLIFSSNNGTERLRLDTDGVFYQNCTGVTGDAPNAAGGVLTQSNGNTKVRIQANGNAAFQFYSPGGGTGSPVGSIVVNASSTSYNTSSDYRLKENVQPMIGALDKIALLKPCTYIWKNTGEEGQGFIAHELQEIVPDAVTGTKDEIREDGTPVYQGVDTSFLVATLTKAIQELKAIVDQQAKRIKALEGAK